MIKHVKILSFLLGNYFRKSEIFCMKNKDIFVQSEVQSNIENRIFLSFLLLQMAQVTKPSNEKLIAGFGFSLRNLFPHNF